MKKDIDIESLFKNIRRKNVDPARIEACQGRLVGYFAQLEAKEEKDLLLCRRTNARRYLVSTVCLMIIISVYCFLFYHSRIISAIWYY
jgi:hypothetical protein